MISLQGKIEIFNKIPADSTIQQFTKVLSAPRYGFDSMNNSLTKEQQNSIVAPLDSQLSILDTPDNNIHTGGTTVERSPTKQVPVMQHEIREILEEQDFAADHQLTQNSSFANYTDRLSERKLVKEDRHKSRIKVFRKQQPKEQNEQRTMEFRVKGNSKKVSTG